MEGIEIDEIGAFRCAIRCGYEVRKPSDVTDQMNVEMARKKSFYMAKYILNKCYLRTYDGDETDKDQHPVVQFLHELAYGFIPATNLKDWEWIRLIPEGANFVSKYSVKLRKDYTEYLTTCFTDAITAHKKYIDDPDGMCLAEKEIPDWLAQAFNLRQDKNAGQPIDLELGADILDGMAFIYLALGKQSDSYASQLEAELQRFTRGDSLLLPHCIERLIKIKGCPQAESYLPEIRGELAEWIPDEIERVRKTINGKVKPNRMMAANIFMKCGDKCVEQVEKLLTRSDISDADKDRLRDRREVLRDYGSESLQSDNKSGNATGFERLFRNHKKSIHSQIKRSPNVRSLKESQVILDDEALQRKKKKARSDPTVRKAIQIIKSPEVGNHSIASLQKLQKQTPNNAQHLWARPVAGISRGTGPHCD